MDCDVTSLNQNLMLKMWRVRAANICTNVIEPAEHIDYDVKS